MILLDCCSPTFPQVTNSNCGFNVGQIVEIMFADPSANPIFANAVALGTKANITAGLGTTLSAFPLVNGSTITPGEQTEIYASNTNDTAYGRRQMSKTWSPSTYNGTFYSLTPTQVAEMANVLCWDSYEVYFRLSDDRIVYRNNAGAVAGFPIYSAMFGPRQVDGLNTLDKNALSFQLDPFWDVDALTTTPVDYKGLAWITL